MLGFRFGCGWCCVVGFLFGCCWFCVLLLCVSAWWNRGIADEVTMASYGRAVTGTAVMARSANEEKKKKGLTREDIWRHLFLTKQRKNPYKEGCYTGEDVEDVKQKWEDKKHYFELYKKDVPRPPCIDLDRAILGFNIDNSAAFQAIEDSKALHARRWQTKEGTYRIKRRALPDVRDAPLQDDNAAASCSDGKPRWRCWDGDYAMGYQHPLMNWTMDTLCFLQEFYI